MQFTQGFYYYLQPDDAGAFPNVPQCGLGGRLRPAHRGIDRRARQALDISEQECMSGNLLNREVTPDDVAPGVRRCSAIARSTTQCGGISIRVRGITPLRSLPADAFAAERPGLRHSRR